MLLTGYQRMVELINEQNRESHLRPVSQVIGVWRARP
jgi:hypothetical protein